MKEILQKLRESDSRTFQQVYKENYPTCRLPIVMDGGTEEEAQTIYNDVSFSFLQKLKRDDFELTSTINAYLKQSCRYSWWAEKRRRQRLEKKYKKISFDDVPQVLDNYNNSETHILYKYYKQMYDCLDKVGDPCTSLLDFTYFEELSDREIAPLFDWTVGYVRVKRTECKKKVIACIQRNQNQEL